jgi:hypothetical protein
MQQIAFTNNANKLALVVQHGGRADPFLQKQLCSFLHGGRWLDGDDRGNHDIADMHSKSPSPKN